MRPGGNGKRCAAARISALGVAIALLPAAVQAGRTGKIAGRVTGSPHPGAPEITAAPTPTAPTAGRPVEAATVAVAGQPLGAYTDAQGQFTILNVPPGTYTVNVSRVGFRPLAIENVLVTADETTRLDVTLEDASLSAEKVVVSAKRLPVEVNLTSSRATVTTQEIQSLPVQELQDVVNLQAGVVNGHFRGGREGEVQYQVDGISMNNAFDNTPSLKVDRSLLQEVQVNSGTFDAEYGQAMSGVVNAVLKEGTPFFQWSSELFAGGFFFPGAESARLTSDPLEPGEIQNYQLSLSGPIGLPKTVYFISGRRYQADDFVYGTRRFQPTDRFNFETKVAHPTGDGSQVVLGFSDEWSGAIKFTNTSIEHTKLSYQALFNHIDGRRSDFTFRFNPDGLREQHTVSIAHGLDWTQVFNKSTYLDLSLRQNYFSYKDYAYADLYDPRYDAAGAAKGDIDYENGAVVQGVDLNRYTQETNALLLKNSVVSQVNHEHQLKGGFELQVPWITFGAPGTITEVNGALVRFQDTPNYPGEKQYVPVIGAAFFQDLIELKTLTVRAGARLDYFDARSTIPSDLSNPANSIQGAPESVPQPTTKKIIASPRLGVAYPITQRAAMHFAYGHFNQFPPIGEMFRNADFSILDSLQAGTNRTSVMGNPDLGPERTVQYEFGYKQAVTDALGFDVTVFYKDIRDLIGTAFISTYNDAEYAMLTNTDFGNVIGFTVSVDHRKLGPASFNFDYTWQQAQGNSSDPRETATRAENHQDPRPRVVPFNWDQHHTLNLTVTLGSADRGSASAVFRAASGQPYTPVVGSGFNTGLEANSGRKPAGFVIDLRGGLRLQRVRGLSFFGRVFNLTDARFFNGAVFNTTGSPYYSLVPVQDAVALEDPTRFYPPRRIELGIILGGGNR